MSRGQNKIGALGLTDVKIFSLSARRLNAITPRERKIADKQGQKSTSRGPRNYPRRPIERQCETTYARVPMPEMETQREWTSLQLLQSPLGSVPGLVTSATRRPWSRHPPPSRSQESSLCQSRLSSKYSPIFPVRIFTPSVTCPRSSIGSLTTRFYGELTRYE